MTRIELRHFKLAGEVAVIVLQEWHLGPDAGDHHDAIWDC